MKSFALVATLAMLAVADARTHFRRPLFSGVPRFQPLPFPGTSDGAANGGITSGITETADGRSRIDSAQSTANGRTTGLGSTSFNTANADFSNSQTLTGSSQDSDATASSVQNTNNGFGFVPIFKRPFGFPGLGGLGGSASGNADGSVTKGVSEGAFGVSRVTEVRASAGGSASNGGSSFNTANASDSRQETAHGVSETSDTGATSNQSSRR